MQGVRCDESSEPTNGPGQIVAVHDGHVAVGDDEIEGTFLPGLEPLRAIVFSLVVVP